MGQVRFLFNHFSLENVFIVFSKLCAVVCGLMAVEHLQLPLTPAGAIGLCSSTENQALAIVLKVVVCF